MERELMGLLPLLIALFNQVDVLMLILVRVSAFLIFLPVLSSLTIPLQFRLFFAFIMSMAIFSSGIVTSVTFNDSAAGFIMLIITEVMTGAIMGFMLYFVMNTMLFAGQLIDFSMGFAMVNVMDPVQQIQVPVIGNLMMMLASALLIVAGGLHIFVKTFFDSYRLIPIGSAFILGNEPLMEVAAYSLVGFIILAVRIAMPLVGVLMLVNVALGIMVKAVPQMNVFIVGMPLKVLIGLVLVFAVMLPGFNEIYNNVFDSALLHMLNMMEGMALDGTNSP
jgi:flagellar biosynthetic protein FliR